MTIGAVVLYLACPKVCDGIDRKPLSVADVEGLCQGGVSSRRIVELIDSYGVSFEGDDGTEARLRAAGATDDVLFAGKRAALEAAQRRLQDEKRAMENERQRADDSARRAAARRAREQAREARSDSDPRHGVSVVVPRSQRRPECAYTADGVLMFCK
jgi:hypothetical protein